MSHEYSEFLKKVEAQTKATKKARREDIIEKIRDSDYKAHAADWEPPVYPAYDPYSDADKREYEDKIKRYIVEKGKFPTLPTLPTPTEKPVKQIAKVQIYKFAIEFTEDGPQVLRFSEDKGWRQSSIRELNNELGGPLTYSIESAKDGIIIFVSTVTALVTAEQAEQTAAAKAKAAKMDDLVGLFKFKKK